MKISATTSKAVAFAYLFSSTHNATSFAFQSFRRLNSCVKQSWPLINWPTSNEPTHSTIATLTVRNMASTSEESISSIDIARNVEDVRDKMNLAMEARGSELTDPVRLVAVSKTKPMPLLEQAYNDANVRVFGENYVQELVEKVPQLPGDVQWHFIGSLQSNKVNLLLRPFLPDDIDRLVLETVGTLKLANKLNNAIDGEKKLKIFVQVNTSGEDSKSGVSPDEVVDLCQSIVQECPKLHLQGLMTIGAPGDEACLDKLAESRNQVVAALGLESLELSMGMSGDYEAAILKGSTNVRVGSTIFGARDYSNVDKK